MSARVLLIYPDFLEENKNKRGLGQMTLKELLKDPPQSKITAARTEVNKRFSLSLASLALGLVAVPLAITAQRRETSIGFLFSVAVAFAFFFFIALAEMFRDKPAFYPHLLMWLPNILFISLGGWMFYRLAKK